MIRMIRYGSALMLAAHSKQMINVLCSIKIQNNFIGIFKHYFRLKMPISKMNIPTTKLKLMILHFNLIFNFI